jgi:hypothetical protein
MHQPGKTEGPGPLSPLERSAVEAILAAAGPRVEPLRAQLAAATVLSRTHSGVGFVTRVVVPEGLPAAADEAASRLRPAVASHPALREGAEFLLQVRHGRLAVLEAWCFAGTWPADESAFRLQPPLGSGTGPG